MTVLFDLYIYLNIIIYLWSFLLLVKKKEGQGQFKPFIYFNNNLISVFLCQNIYNNDMDS